MADLFYGVPCGFGQPGELPQSLPPGVHGGSVFVPTDPGNNGELEIVIIEPVIPPPVAPPAVPVPDPPVIIGPNIVVTQVQGDLSYSTNLATNVICKLYQNLIQVATFTDLTSYVTSRQITFTNLTPETTYTFSITVAEQILGKKTTINGNFTTLADVVVPPNGGNPPLFPGQPGIIVEKGPEPPNGNTNSTEIVDPSILNQNISPNQNPTSLGNDPYIQFLINSNNNGNIDLKFTPYKITPTSFLPQYGTKYDNIFSKIRHKSIDNILNEKVTSFEVTNIDYFNITKEHLKSSLVKRLQGIFDLKYPNGISVDSNTIFNFFKRHIEGQTIDKIDIDYLLKLTKDKKENTKESRSSIQKSGYGVSKSNLIQNRKAKRSIKTNISTKQPFTIDELKKKLKPIDRNKFTGEEAALLKLWYFIPEDINKRVLFQRSDGSIDYILVDNNDTIQYTTTNGTVVEAEINVDDTITVTFGDESQEDRFLVSDIDKAAVLNPFDEHELMNRLGITKEISLEVSSTNTDIEFNYEVSDIPDSHYVLMLDTDSIENSNSETSLYIKETFANYTVETNVNTINNEIKYRAYPWLVLTIDHNDPIWEYFINDPDTNTFKFKFTDFSFKNLDFESSNDILVRRIPKFIIVLPTDKTQYNIFNGRSILEDWNVRSIRWTLSPDAELSNTSLIHHPLVIENTFIHSSAESKEGAYSTQDFHCVYSSIDKRFEATYKDFDNRDETRLEIDGLRKAIKVATALVEDYEIDGGLTWYDILSRLSRRELYTFANYAKPKLFNSLKNGEVEAIGEKIFHVEGPKSNP